MIDFLLDVLKISIAVFVVNKLMFWWVCKHDKEYYPEVAEQTKERH